MPGPGPTQICRSARKPYAVVINSAPPKREDVEAPAVIDAREALKDVKAPVWAGQITARSALALALALTVCSPLYSTHCDD